MNQDLQAVVMPVGAVCLEWAETEGRIDKSRDLLQREIFRRFSEDPDSSFLFLGFCDQSVPFLRRSTTCAGSAPHSQRSSEAHRLLQMITALDDCALTLSGKNQKNYIDCRYI
jgi:hypothetical protein